MIFCWEFLLEDFWEVDGETLEVLVEKGLSSVIWWEE